MAELNMVVVLVGAADWRYEWWIAAEGF